MKKTEEEIKKIIIESVEEARACFDTEQEFIAWLDQPVNHEFAALRNKEWEEIILTVVNNSTWGSHKTGGPVWVMDFSYENVKSLLPDNPWVPYFSKDKYNDSIRFMISYAEDFIRETCINNVLLIYPNVDPLYDNGTRPRMSFFTDYRILKFIDLNVYSRHSMCMNKLWHFSNYSLENRSTDLLLGAEIRRLLKGAYTVYVDKIPEIPIADKDDMDEYWAYPLYHIDKGMLTTESVKKSDKIQDYFPMYIADVMEYMRLDGLDIDMRHEFRYVNGQSSERVALLKRFGTEHYGGIVPVNRVDKVKMVYQTLELKMPEITEEHWFKQFPKKIKWEEL